MFEKIAAIEFEVLTGEKAAALSSVQIKTRQLYDDLMDATSEGPLDKRLGCQSLEACIVCGDKDLCPGHFGHVKLPLPVFHIGFIKHTVRILNCLCLFCGSLLSDSQSSKSLKMLLKESLKIKSCPRCNQSREMVRCDKNLRLTAGSNEISPLTAHKLLSILSKKDCERLGLKQKPSHLLMNVLPVLPNVARPSVRSGMKSAEDDITLGVSAVAGSSDALLRAIEGGCSHSDAMGLNYSVQESVMGIISSNDQRGLIQRLRGKHGRFRGTLSGKRVDHTARTVISPDPNLPLGCVGVPITLLSILTFPETVNSSNIKRLQDLVNKRVYPSTVTIERGQTLKSVKFSKKCDLFLKEGDIVHRHLRRGDLVLLNRQPSLHRLSILAHEVVPSNSSTISFNECVCAPFNADFDGDEMNLHIPQDIQAVAEARTLMPVKQNLCTPRNGEPLVAATQDFVTAMYSLTSLDNFLDRREFSRLCCSFGELPYVKPCFLRPVEIFSGKQVFNVLLQSALSKGVSSEDSMPTTFNTQIDPKNAIYCSSTTPRLESQSILEKTAESQYPSEGGYLFFKNEKLENFSVHTKSNENPSISQLESQSISEKTAESKYPSEGGYLFFKNEKLEKFSTYKKTIEFFNHRVSNKKEHDNQIVVNHGQFLAGQVNKQIIGSENKKTSLISALIKVSPESAIHLLNSIAKLSSAYLSNRGFSLGLNDVEPTRDILQSKEKTVQQIYEKCEEKLQLFYTNQLEIMPGCTMIQSLESALSALLSQIRDILGNECIKKQTAPTLMQDAGSKGSKINVAQMVACVGQQIISGKRICDSFSMNPQIESEFVYKKLSNIERKRLLTNDGVFEIDNKMQSSNKYDTKAADELHPRSLNPPKLENLSPDQGNFINVAGSNPPDTENISPEQKEFNKVILPNPPDTENISPEQKVFDKVILPNPPDTENLSPEQKVFDKVLLPNIPNSENLSPEQVNCIHVTGSNPEQTSAYQHVKHIHIDSPTSFENKTDFAKNPPECVLLNSKSRFMPQEPAYVQNFHNQETDTTEKHTNIEVTAFNAEEPQSNPQHTQSLPETRTLPHFHAHNALTPIAKGFVKNSFYSGLSPTEFFFHAASGREGLVDTAVKTAETGYMQRRLMKALEDLRTLYDGTIRNSHNEIIQFHSESEPGTADGALAAQSIGEPGTQMTLKTFHFAGVASMNITLGVPRIKEIINATRNINTPLIKAELVCHKAYNDISGAKEKNKTKRKAHEHTQLGSNVQSTARIDMDFENTSNYDSLSKKITSKTVLRKCLNESVLKNVHSDTLESKEPEILKRSDHRDSSRIGDYVSPKNRDSNGGQIVTQNIFQKSDHSDLSDNGHFIPSKNNDSNGVEVVTHDIFKKSLDSYSDHEDNALPSLIFAQTVKAKIEKTFLRDITTLLTETYGTREIYIVIDIDFTVIQQLLIPVTMESIKNDIHDQHKIPLDHISSTQNQMTVIIKKDYFAFKAFKRKVLNTVICGIQSINRCVLSQEKNKEYTLIIEGHGLHHVLATSGIKTATTNSILEIADVLGIEAARQSIINEITYTMDNHGITIYRKHVELLADTMTFRGQTLGITRHGIGKIKSSALMLASFEQTADHLFDAAVKNTVDEIKGVSECIILGKPMNVGTGMISLIYNPSVNQ